MQRKVVDPARENAGLIGCQMRCQITRKIRHKDEVSALRQLAAHIAGVPDYKGKPYKCNACGDWHIGRRKQKATILKKPDPVKLKYPYINVTLKNFFCLDLTDEQIEKYGKTHPVLKKDVPDDICDTIDRELLIDAIVVDVLGNKWHWPLFGDVASYGKAFYPKFFANAASKGIKVTKAAGAYL